MAVSVTHATEATLPNDPTKEVSSDAWNEGHTVTGFGDAAEKNVGTGAGDVAAGNAPAAAQAAAEGTAAAALTAHEAAANPHPGYLTPAEGDAAYAAISHGTHVPNGGTTGQVLKKVSDDDGDVAWDTDETSVGGGVDTANSPNANEFARFTDADTIEGRTASEARTDLGLVIGTNVQAHRLCSTPQPPASRPRTRRSSTASRLRPMSPMRRTSMLLAQ